MNKAELIESIMTNMEESGFPIESKAQAGRLVDCFCETVMTALSEGDDVRLVGFGTFTPNHRKARTGVNPQTGEPMDIPASVVPKFKPGSKFKERLKG